MKKNLVSISMIRLVVMVVVLFLLVSMGCASHKGVVGGGLMRETDVQLNDGVRRSTYTAQIISLRKENKKGDYSVGLDIYAAVHRLECTTSNYVEILSLLKYGEKNHRKLVLTVEYGKGITSPRIVAAKRVDE